jgi:predicted alpha/beta superfamily hydrolase
MSKDNINIKIIKNFKSKIMKNKRNIRIYLPPSYSAKADKYYPVLYVHDGQNVFDALESYSGQSWDLHRTAEYLIKRKMIEEIIIVAVDNMGEQRLSEYAHQDGFFQGAEIKGRGTKYEEFFIKELMPFIESKYRIKKGSENTALMGSSMGGLITFNMGLRRPDLFGKLGVISPSLWWGKNDASAKLKSYDYSNLKSKIWLDTGDAEGKFMSFSESVIAELKNIQNKNELDLVYYQAPDAVHSESAWAERVHSPLLYFFGEIGEIEKIELIGRETISLNSHQIRINPVLTFDSFFKMTALEGEYKSLKPELLNINDYGTLIPKKTGSAEIKFTVFGYSAFKNIKIVKKLNSKVNIDIYLQLKEQKEAEIKAVYLADNEPQEVKMEHLDNSYYKSSLSLERDEIINFKFTLGSWSTVEKDGAGRDVESHFIKADEDKTLYFEVEKFGGLSKSFSCKK